MFNCSFSDEMRHGLFSHKQIILNGDDVLKYLQNGWTIFFRDEWLVKCLKCPTKYNSHYVKMANSRRVGPSISICGRCLYDGNNLFVKTHNNVFIFF